MTTRYVGCDDGVVIAVSDKGRSRVLGRFRWGNRGMYPETAALAKKLLIDVLDDEVRATKLHRIFMHRVFSNTNESATWNATTEQIMLEVKSIEETAADAAKTIKRSVDRPPPTPVGPAIGGKPMEGTWSPGKEPTLRRNDPWAKEAKE